MVSPTKYAIKEIQVATTFDRYPDVMRDKLMFLRQLIIDTANELNIDNLEETLKWGEPSYLTVNGSTIRLAWRKSSPEKYGIFFNCKTSLIETFREIYPSIFTYEGNRAIIFDLNDTVPVAELKQCIELSFCYHTVKNLPMLGI